MFYEPEKNNHGLPFNAFKSCVVPRPIAWISTVNLQGVAECPISLECKHQQTIVLPSSTRGLFNSVVIGRVVGVHIADSVIGADGKVDIARIRPLARLGYMDYTSVTEIFELRPTGTSEATLRGMSGGRPSGS